MISICKLGEKPGFFSWPCLEILQAKGLDNTEAKAYYIDIFYIFLLFMIFKEGLVMAERRRIGSRMDRMDCMMCSMCIMCRAMPDLNMTGPSSCCHKKD